MLVLIAVAPAAHAHLTPSSSVELDFNEREVSAQITIPLAELSYAYGEPLPTPQAMLASRLILRAPDGRLWRMVIKSSKISGDQFARDQQFDVSFTPPAGALLRKFALTYTLVTDKVATHNVLVFARSDFNGGTLQGHPEMIGAFQQVRSTINIDRGEASAWNGFFASITLGMRHIAEGHDHLLFLITLLLPAPLIAVGRRWGAYEGIKPTLRQLLMVVTAFTIGHSITLIGGAFFGWQLPSQPVEIAIAVSILVSAIHAWRPLFAGREALVAASFGLIHGLAFATVIANFGLEPLAKATAILGFNLGIELVQIGVILGVLPLLIWLAQSPHFGIVRNVAAGLAAAAALAWVFERVTETENGFARGIDVSLGYAPFVIIPLSIVALGALIYRSRLERVSL